MASEVDFALLDVDQRLVKGDCEMKLHAFFEENTPKSFTKVHEGVSGNDVHYMIGELDTDNGIYRITTYLNKSGDDYRIQSLEIEK